MKKKKVGLALVAVMCATMFVGCKENTDDVDKMTEVEITSESLTEEDYIDDIIEETSKEVNEKFTEETKEEETKEKETVQEETVAKYTNENYMEAYKDYILGNYKEEGDIYNNLYSSDAVCFFPSSFAVCDVNNDGYQDVMVYGPIGIRQVVEGELCMWDGEKINVFVLDEEPTMYGKNILLFNNFDYTGAGEETIASTYVDEYHMDGSVKNIVISQVTEKMDDNPIVISKRNSINGKDVSEAEAEAKIAELKATMKEITPIDFSKDNINKFLKEDAGNEKGIVLLEKYPDIIYERYGEANVKAYEPILTKACEIFANENETPSWGGELSISYPFAGGTEHIFKSIGFVIQDFSGDGIPELYIGELDDASKKNEIVTSDWMDCLYTLKDGKPVMTTYGGFRIIYNYLGGNQFFLEASGGAGNQHYGLYTLSKDGTQMNCVKCYNTDFDDVYSNTTGDQNDRSNPVDRTELDAFIEKYDHPLDVKMTLFYNLVQFQ